MANSTSRRFNVGEIECAALNDGTFSYPTGWLFSNVEQNEVENTLRERGLSTGSVESPYTCLLIRSGKHRILVDSGADGLAPTTGNLLKNLEAEGVFAAEITEVVLTHGHPDHIGGVLDADVQPAFTNARYIMSRTEWDFWNDPSVLHDSAMDTHMKQLLVGCAQKNLPALKAQIELFDGERDIAPGVRAVPAPGHTPGHIAMLISSCNAQLLDMVDAALHPLNLEFPTWRNVFDLDAQQAAETRTRLFDRAVTEKMTALAYHFPFPGLGFIKRRGSAFRWEVSS
jgi:glyoxylase-like metal-dependent hydrolase (beta-lactamase superfamily II)